MKRFQLNSLIGRILIFTFTGLLLVLIPLGFIIDKAYQNSLKESIEKELSGHAYNLIRIMDESNSSLHLPSYLQEQRFNRNQSGLSAYLVEQKLGLIWQSLSSQALINTQYSVFIDRLSEISSGEKRFELIADNESPRFSYQYAFEWEFSSGQVTRFLAIVHLSAKDFNNQISQMRSQLLTASLILILVVMLLQISVVIMGLLPLTRISKQLSEIEQGERQGIEGKQPIELVRFVTNLNLLLASLRRQSEQYQNRMADLAHALKTPLSIINNQLTHCETHFTLELNKQIKAVYEIREPLETIDQIVRYQLQRTVTPDSNHWHQKVEVTELTAKIVRGLQKVYQQKSLSVHFDPSQKIYFYGDSGDFYELAGNLIDNAFKAAKNCVKIELVSSLEDQTQKQRKESTIPSITLTVEDDGPGVAPDKRRAILNRGIRLDTLKAGQGIGLSVVSELVASYHGTLSIEDSQLGGAKFRITC